MGQLGRGSELLPLPDHAPIQWPHPFLEPTPFLAPIKVSWVKTTGPGLRGDPRELLSRAGAGYNHPPGSTAGSGAGPATPQRPLLSPEPFPLLITRSELNISLTCLPLGWDPEKQASHQSRAGAGPLRPVGKSVPLTGFVK